MTESMVDRVARALMAATKDIDCGDLKLKHHYAMARAAIEAMQEPTELMAERGADRCDGSTWQAEAVYRAMIEAALK